MKKLILPLVACLIFSSACNKTPEENCDPITTTAPDSEVNQVKAYLDATNINNAVKDPRGFYYRINAAGSAEKPTPCNTVEVGYTGTFTDGQVFDQTAPGKTVSFPLKNVIVGWTEGVPLIGKGGDIDLFLPPTLAYGSTARSGIPANSILVFNIRLVSF